MKRGRYFEEAQNSFAAGRVDEDVFWAMIENADIFCDEEEDDED